MASYAASSAAKRPLAEKSGEAEALSQLSVRINPGNPNHHLWNNNGTWFIHYVKHPTPITKERVRQSLQTKSLAEARIRRDQLLAGL